MCLYVQPLYKFNVCASKLSGPPNKNILGPPLPTCNTLSRPPWSLIYSITVIATNKEEQSLSHLNYKKLKVSQRGKAVLTDFPQYRL